MDVKKLGAVVGGAALLASSVAFGAVLYENTTLVDANGQIVAKVVVGQNAAASDGVGAAKIAAALASKAYKPVTYSAQVEGTAVCTATAGNTSGSCTVTNKAADIGVILPGLTSTSVVDLRPYVAEELDTELQDREYTDYLDVVNDLWDDDANPYQDQIGGTGNLGGGPTQVNASVVDYRNFDAFQVWTVTGKYLDAKGIKEKERAYVQGYSWYDSGDNEVKFKLNDVVYTAVFGPGDNGLPVCPGDTNKNYATCDSDKSLASSRAAIKFLGEKWYITKVVIPNQDPAGTPDWNSDTEVVEWSGAEVHLAKEAQYGIVNVGESLETPDGKYKVRLDDINKNDRLSNPAIISVLDENNQTVAQDQVAPGETKEIMVGSDTIRVHVYQTAPGHALQAKWAEMAVLEDSIVLKHGDDFLNDGDTQYTVYLGWTNENAATDTDGSQNATHLKEIALVASSLGEDLSKGGKFYLTDVEGHKNFAVEYKGLESQPKTKLTLKYRTSSKTGTLADGSTTFNVQEYVEVDPGVEVRLNGVSDGTSVVGTKRVDKFYYVVRAAGGSGVDEGDILLKADGDWYKVEGSGATLSVDYKKAGSNGKLHFSDPNAATGDELTLSLEESIGKVGGVDAYANVSVITSSANDELHGLTGGQDDEVTWDKDSSVTLGYGYTSNTEYETPFVSPRGTVVKGSGDSRTFEIPEKVRKLEILFKPEGNVTVEPNMVTLRNMTEGEVRDVPGGDGLKVKLLKVYAETSGAVSCPTPEASMDGVSAAIYEGDTKVGETVTAYEPAYATAYPSDVVVFDNSPEANAATVVSVGGPAVNQKTAELLQGSDVELSADNNVVVKQVASGKIVVAGWTAEDTLQAVDQFLSRLTVN